MAFPREKSKLSILLSRNRALPSASGLHRSIRETSLLYSRQLLGGSGQRKTSTVHLSLHAPNKVGTREALCERDGLREYWTVYCFLLHSSQLFATNNPFQILNVLLRRRGAFFGYSDFHNVFRLRKVFAHLLPVGRPARTANYPFVTRERLLQQSCRLFPNS